MTQVTFARGRRHLPMFRGAPDDPVRRRTRELLNDTYASHGIPSSGDAFVKSLADVDVVFGDVLPRVAHQHVALGVAPHACTRHCSYCCYRLVRTTPIEVLGLAHRVITTAGGAVDGVVDMLRANVAELGDARDPSGYAKQSVRCALLDADDLCSHYDARPAACRAWHSKDVRPCADAYDQSRPTTGAPIDVVYTMHATAIESGWRDALARRHGPRVDQALELQRALLIALTERDVAARWVGGEDVFAPAAISTLESPKPAHAAVDVGLADTPDASPDGHAPSRP